MINDIIKMKVSYICALLFLILFNLPPLAESAEITHNHSAFDASDIHDITINPALSLSELINQTFDSYPDAKSLSARTGIVAAYMKRAGSLLPYAPIVGINLVNDKLSSDRGENTWNLGVTFPIWFPEQKATRSLVAQNMQEGVISARDSLKLQVAGEVRNALWMIFINENQSELAKQRVEMAKSLLHDVERRFQLGDLAKADVLLAQNELYLAQSQLVIADRNFVDSIVSYEILTKRHDRPQAFTEDKTSKTFDESHIIFKEAQQEIMIAQAQRDLVAIERRQNLTISTGWQRARSGFDPHSNSSITLGINIPLNLDGQTAPVLAEAEGNVTNKQIVLLNLQRALHKAYHEATHNLRVIRDEIDIYQKQYNNADAYLKLSKKAFSLGEIDLFNLLRVQLQYLESLQALEQRKILLNWYIANYNQAVGVLP